MSKEKIIVDAEIQDVFRDLDPSELEHLEESIKTEGVRVPLTVWKETCKLVDGYQRYALAQKHQKEFQVQEISFASKAEAIFFRLKNGLGRRNLHILDKVAAALQFEPFYHELGKKNQGTRTDLCPTAGQNLEKIDTLAELAKIVKCSRSTFADWAKVVKEAKPQEIESLRNGTQKLNSIKDRIHDKNMDMLRKSI